ncbi:MAG: hypothetical protein QOG04_1403 [Actinomycetota bacterium]|jgi:hypothetical protein|nr:hypothetical protein [Actinomycetota bacterium]
MTRSEDDVVRDAEVEMDKAEEGDDQTRLETLEKVHEKLESELNEGAETPPA